MDSEAVLTEFTLLPDRASYERKLRGREGDERWRVELGLARLHRGHFPGYCELCGKASRFGYNLGGDDEVPNWREELRCPHCQLFCRIRFSLSYLLANLQTAQPQIYITEQITPAFAWLKRRWPDTIGSEFIVDETPVERLTDYLRDLTGDPEACLRHEDLTALSMPDASQDAVLSFDVLEHVPDTDACLREIFRILRPGGHLVFTVPIRLDIDASILRARIGPDGIEHLEEPEYHGDPAIEQGCLAFHTFAWDLLERLRQAGFGDVGLLDAWCPATGILGTMGAIAARR